MSVNFNVNVSSTNFYSSIESSIFGGAFSGGAIGGSINAQALMGIADSFSMLSGGGFNLNSAFASLAEPFLPRPPQFGAGLQQAASSFNEFLGGLGGFSKGGGFGEAQYLGLQAMGHTLNGYMATQSLFQQTNISNLHIGIDATVTHPAQLKRAETDEFGVGTGAGAGHRSNLANSPEVVLALNNILKDSPDNMSLEDTQKKLKDQYGIESKIEDVEGRKALKFANGDTFVDTSGNGMLGTTDYNFKGAVDSIKTKYGLTDDDMKNFDSKDGQAYLGQLANAREQMYMPHEHQMHFGMDITSVNSWFGMQNSFLNMDMFNPIFAKAFELAF